MIGTPSDGKTPWLLALLVALAGVVSCSSSRPITQPASPTILASTSTSTSAVRQTTTTRHATTPTIETSTTGLLPPAPADFSVLVENKYWVDPSRQTVAHGKIVAGSRTLTTRLFIPAQDGTPALRNGPFPLFVWAHGFDATVDYFEPLLRAWAARGYVVVAPLFPLTRAGAPAGGVYDDYVNQPADVSFVITRALAMGGPSGTEYRNLVDPARIGVGGHSLGAVTSIAMTSYSCCLDRRVRAAVSIDGSTLPLPGHSVASGVPALFMHGDADRTFPVGESYGLFGRARSPKYLVVLRGMPHTPFAIPSAYEVIESIVGEFLDVYLKPNTRTVTDFVTNARRWPIASVVASP